MEDKKIFLFGGTHPTIYHPFVSSFLPTDLQGKKILDIGCGRGVWGYLLRTQRDVRKAEMIGVDASDYALSFVKKHRVYTKTLKIDIKKKLPFPDKSFDFILCSEVIEHIVKKEGVKLLKEIDRLIKPGGRVIVTTPNVFLEMPYHDPLDLHRSLWTVKDFSSRGYKVKGIGVKLPFNKTGWQVFIIQALYYFITPFSYLFPQISGLLIAIKDY